MNYFFIIIKNNNLIINNLINTNIDTQEENETKTVEMNHITVMMTGGIWVVDDEKWDPTPKITCSNFNLERIL